MKSLILSLVQSEESSKAKMQLSVQNISKKYRREWIFKEFSYDFLLNNRYGIEGYNGSGKSTLLKIISGQLIPSGGKILISKDGTFIPKEVYYQEFIFIAPYIELIEEFSVQELLIFSQKTGLIPIKTTLEEFLEFTELKNTEDKLIKDYSSGMKQKLKLGLGLLSDRTVLLLDEPTTNLDKAAKEWFYTKLKAQTGKIILIASNEEEDLALCQTKISILNYKN